MAHPLAEKLAELEHRLVVRRWAVAACAAVATVLGAALVLGAIDFAVRYNDRGLRVMASAALVAVAGWAAYRWWYVPSRRRLGPLEVARRVETRFPELGDSLASALEFLGESEDDATAGSAVLRRAVINQAGASVEGLSLDEVIDNRPLRRAAAWAGGVVALVVVCLLLDAGAVGTAAARLAAPLGATTWPRQHHLEFRDLPTRLAAGGTFEVELADTAGPLPDEVRIEYRSAGDGREVTSEWMTRVGDVMVARREDVRRSFAFRAEGGDDRAMPWRAVEVIEPPRVEALSIVTHPPAYTGRPSAPVGGWGGAERTPSGTGGSLRSTPATPLGNERLDMLAGTGIELAGTADRPLRAARVVVGEDSIAATVGSDDAGHERRSFRMAPDRWVAAESGPWRLELEGDDGLAGTAARGELHVEPDAPPSVSWQRPREDLYVTAAAVVPLAVEVKDDLAIQAIELVYERSDRPDTAQPAVELYRGPERVADTSVDGGEGSTRSPATRHPHPGPLPKGEGIGGETRRVAYDWDLEPLELTPGTRLTINVEATDYRPGTGRTVVPRRVTIITAEELDARLANRQAEIVRQLEQALALQRTARSDAHRVEIQQTEAHALTAGDRDALRTAELNQRRVGRMLVDPTEGVPALAAALLAELDTNGVERPDAVTQMERLDAVLARLAAGPLPTAERELTAARKSAEAATDAKSERLVASLSAAGGAQEDVIAAVTGLLNELTPWTDFGRFARQIAQLRKDQLAHREATRRDVGTETLTLELRELNAAQRASLASAAAGQDALARRLEAILQSMREWIERLGDQSEAADGARSLADQAAAVGDALEVARRQAIDGSMRDAARELADNRVGQALAHEEQVATDLQEMLDVLQQRSEQDAQRLVDRLVQAEQELAALRKELAALARELARAEAAGAGGKCQQLRAQIERLSRRLERLQADAAAGSTRRAAERLEQQRGGEREATRRQVQQAERDLAEAAEQLAQRRAQAEFNLQREFINRFVAALGPLVARQRDVVDKITALDVARASDTGLTPAQRQEIDQLAQAEQSLADEVREHREVLFGLGSLRLALGRAAGQLAATGELLSRQDTGAAAQQSGQAALAQLERIADALRQTAAEAAGEPGGAGAGAGGQAGNRGQRQPAFDLLEVKLLRMLQAELNERTRDFGRRLTEARAAGGGDKATFQREAAELAAEQGRLAELVREILARNNEEGER